MATRENEFKKSIMKFVNIYLNRLARSLKLIGMPVGSFKNMSYKEFMNTFMIRQFEWMTTISAGKSIAPINSAMMFLINLAIRGKLWMAIGLI